MFKRKVNSDKIKTSEQATQEFRKGSAEAFQLLYNEYSQKVYSFCLRMLGEEEQAEDAFQETFVRVYENSHRFTGENFKSWLFTIARNTCLNIIRSRRPLESYDDVFHNVQTIEMDNDVGMKDFIKKSIEKVPVQLRESLILREYQGMSYQEISEILDIDINLAKVRVHRARLILRKLLQPLVKELNES